MKMKEVCAQSGLTERAVRLYCAHGLLTPERTEVRGRIYLEFDDSDVAVLRQIAILRSVGFSLEEIRCMQNEPQLIGGTLAALRDRLEEERLRCVAIGDRLARLDAGAALCDMAALADALISATPVRPYANTAVFRHDEPSFPEFCAHRDADYRGDPDSLLDRRIRRGRVVMTVYSLLYWLLCAVLLIGAMTLENGLFVVLLLGAGAVGTFVLLRRDVGWVRGVLCIFHFFGAVVSASFIPEHLPITRTVIRLMPGGGYVPTVYAGKFSWMLVAFLLIALLNAAAVYFLGFNKWVSEYLYDCATRDER